MRKPRDSRPTSFVQSGKFLRIVSSSTSPSVLRSFASLKIGMMFLKIIPGLGKSGWSVIAALSSASFESILKWFSQFFSTIKNCCRSTARPQLNHKFTTYQSLPSFLFSVFSLWKLGSNFLKISSFSVGKLLSRFVAGLFFLMAFLSIKKVDFPKRKNFPFCNIREPQRRNDRKLKFYKIVENLQNFT